MAKASKTMLLHEGVLSADLWVKSKAMSRWHSVSPWGSVESAGSSLAVLTKHFTRGMCQMGMLGEKECHIPQ